MPAAAVSVVASTHLVRVRARVRVRGRGRGRVRVRVSVRVRLRLTVRVGVRVRVIATERCWPDLHPTNRRRESVPRFRARPM